MNKLYLENIQFSGMMHTTRTGFFETLKPFSYEFEFGKTYGIEGAMGSGAWGLSWIIGGAIVPNQGRTVLDGTQINAKRLRASSWLVSYDEIKRFGFIRQSVKGQVRAGSKKIDEKELLEAFLLTTERYSRKLTQMRAEKYRASSAIGFAHGKTIFCFPHMHYLRPKFIFEYRSFWLEDMLNFLKASGALVLFPSQFSQDEATMFDHIIHLEA